MVSIRALSLALVVATGLTACVSTIPAPPLAQGVAAAAPAGLPVASVPSVPREPYEPEIGKVASKATDRLLQAGFNRQAIEGPARLSKVRELEPRKLTTLARGDLKLYVYTDPAGCGCFYLGNQASYDRYQELTQAKERDLERRREEETERARRALENLPRSMPVMIN